MALSKHNKYDLKRKYYRVLQISLILSLSLLILAFKFFPDVNNLKLDTELPQVLLEVVDLPPLVEPEVELPPPPKPPIPIEAPTDDILEDVEFKPTELDPDAEVLAPPPPKVKDDIPIPDFFIVVEEMPEPIGGIGAIQKQIIYPEIAKRAGIQGKVFVKAFVDEKGNIFKVELSKGIGGGCDEAALKAVKNSMFSPGRQRGKPVKVQVTIPILFKLQ